MVTVYFVFVTPSAHVTTIGIGFLPTVRGTGPNPCPEVTPCSLMLSVELVSASVAVIVVLVVAFGTDTLYVVVFGSNCRAPAERARLARVV